MQQIDDAGQLMLVADRQMDGDAAVGELATECLERAKEIRALAIEHVHEDDAGELELLGALPDAARVHLDAHHAARDDDRALDDPEGRRGVRLEARVAGRIDEVDLALLPVQVSERGRQRHLPLLLFLLPVRDGRAGLDRAEAVRLPRLKEQRLGQGGLPRASMADDGDVANLPGLVSHGPILIGWNQASRPMRVIEPPRRAFRRRIALVWSCETRDSVTPRTSPISLRVRSS